MRRVARTLRLFGSNSAQCIFTEPAGIRQKGGDKLKQLTPPPQVDLSQ